MFILAGGKVGGKSIPYAKKREYENRLNPGTRYYMRNAFRDVTRDYQQFFKGLTA